MVIWKFESSEVSQPVRVSEKGLPSKQKVPPMAGFRELGTNLQAPVFDILGAK